MLFPRSSSLARSRLGRWRRAARVLAASALVAPLLVNGGTASAAQTVSGGGPTRPGDDSCSAVPVNPRATAQAKKLLCYFYSQYGNHIISGQEESTWVAGSEYEMNYIHGKTGKYPAIRGMDIEQDGIGGRGVSWWNAGGIPMVGYHMGAPTKPDTYEGSKMAVSINAVLTPGTAEYASFVQRLDHAAAQLQIMENAAVPVLWRPFHEAGGTWFWWSKEGGSQYKRLWQFEYNYLTNTKGLDNLVWLLPFNGQPSSSFYPGKSYVDIAGSDTYAGDYGPQTGLFNATKNIVGGTIPIALHENGPIPDPDQLQSSNTRWVMFNTWHTDWLTNTSHNSISQLKKTYNSSYVVTRDEVPNLK